jgi:hypothetical protein
MPSKRRCRLATMIGSKLASRSRDTSISTGPIWSQHRLRPRPVTRISAVTAHRVVLVIIQVLRHFRFQGGLEDGLGQPRQQPTRPDQIDPSARARSMSSSANLC